MKILITGLTGFLGAAFGRFILENTDWEIYSLERNTMRLSQLGEYVADRRIHRYPADITQPIRTRAFFLEPVDYIVHCAANVNAFQSLAHPRPVLEANIGGTFNILELARELQPRNFIYISSAEVLGPASVLGPWRRVVASAHAEDAPLDPRNPYSASKASGELLCQAYAHAYQMPISIVRTMNIFGKQQDCTKFLPAVTRKVLRGEKITMHVDADGVPGSRQWIHVDKVAEVLFEILHKSIDIYHVIGPELDNREIIALVEEGLQTKAEVESMLPNAAHVMRYALRNTKLMYSTADTVERILETVRWYKDNQEWLV